jgi:methionyl-tRNA formyltransferase
LDQGGVIWSKQLKRENYINFGLATAILSQQIVEGAIYILQHTLQRKPLAILQQNQKAAAYYKRPLLADVLINWENMTATTVENLVLACNPWNKGAISMLNGQEVKILDAFVASENPGLAQSNLRPGTIVSIKDVVCIACKDHSFINVSMFTINGTFIPARNASFLSLATGQRFDKAGIA